MRRGIIISVVLGLLVLAGVGWWVWPRARAPRVVQITAPLLGEVPPLPFPNNPDPEQCGIPQPWGNDEVAYLHGYYEGTLVEPMVHLYDGHLRNNVIGHAPTGSAVRIKLYQANPVLDYYLVRTLHTEPPQEGWVPAPFLRFAPPAEPDARLRRAGGGQ